MLEFQFDCLASLLVGAPEQNDVFIKLEAFPLLLKVMATQKEVRSDSLKVLSVAMAGCIKPQAIDFINRGGLPVIFGYLMR